ncbi:MAG: TIGR03546 family protein [Thermoguttaceae bacterium]
MSGKKMLFRGIRPLQYLVDGISGGDTPHQLALGFTIGMMIGLVPKGNLTAVALSMILLGTRVNLATGMLGALCFSWVSVWTDPLADRIGQGLLTHEPLQPLFAWLFDLPLAPWTALDNTVVFGSLMLGTWLFWPVYHFACLGFEKLQPRLARYLERYRVSAVLDHAELAARWRK